MQGNGWKPLSGLRVLEFGHIAAAPFTGMLLADLGADVVKVEQPSGDGMRAWPPIVENPLGERYSLNFAALNRNKRSIVADLKEPEQLTKVRGLCAAADVIVENYRPGVMDRLGLGFSEVGELNAAIVYCSISGYGQTGVYSKRGAYDVVVQGMSGLMSVTGEEHGAPVKCGVPVGDFVTGLYAGYSILAARAGQRRERGPVYLDCSMLDCLLGISALQTSEYWGTNITPARMGSAHPRNAPYQAFDAADGPFIIAAGNDMLWRDTCTVIAKPELVDDPRFVSVPERARQQKVLAAILQDVFKEHSADYWLSEFERLGIPCGRVNTFAEILSDAHVVERGLIHGMSLPIGGTTKTFGFPVRMSGYDFSVYAAPPKLGAHTDEVYATWSEATVEVAAHE
ncbi:MAG: CaiB/BaiF CoA transferase family protein [Vulcanimicrobiaceae bacterium]